MQFDSSAVWDRAVGWIRLHSAVIVPVAGVFVLVPALALFWFTSDLQVALEAMVGKTRPGDQPWDLLALVAKLYGLAMATALVQSIGTMALTAIFADPARPTVGEAIRLGLRCLPTTIGATLVMLAGFSLAGAGIVIVVSVLAGLLSLVAGAGVAIAVGVIAGMAALGVIVWLLVRLSMISPSIVLERQMNPLAAIQRSWTVTRNRAGALALFFLLIVVCLVVLSLIVQSVAGLAIGAGPTTRYSELVALGSGSMIAYGLLTNLIGAVATTIFTAVITASFLDLRGNSPDSISRTFG
jgi:hypothetical protein